MRKATSILSRHKIKAVLFVAVAATLPLTCHRVTGAGASEALARAKAFENEGKLPQAEKALRDAEREPALRHWSQLIKAEIIEKKGDKGAAFSAYLAVPKESAASLDAAAGMLRSGTAEELRKAVGDPGIFISGLEQKMRRAKRTDLLPDLFLAKAKMSEEDKQFSLAAAQYSQTRSNYPGTPAASAAREALQRLAQANPELQKVSPADLLAEAEILLKEREPLLALQSVQKAREQTTAGSPAYFEALLGEEQALRQLKRTEEANRLLAIISADGGPGTADRALSKLTKLAWNAGETDKALAHAAHFLERFKAAETREEIMYIRGRLYEEKGLPKEAKAVYEEIAAKSSSETARTRALQQLAWLHLRDNEFKQAAEYFGRMAEQAGLTLSAASSPGPASPSLPPLREIQESRNHALYWLAYSLAQAPKIKVGSDTPDVIYRQLIKEQPFSYYAFLARTKVGESGLLLPDPDPSCTITVPEDRLETLTLLGTTALKQFAQAEVDWFLLEQDGTAEGAEFVRQEITRAKLYGDYGVVNKSAPKANYLLRADSSTNCAALLFSLSYPLPYAQEFGGAAAKNLVPVPLLYALARTESYFDAQAVSPKDARGLMQLLPETAAQEGTVDSSELFLPAVNIQTGAKHFKNLLSKYQGEKIFAIAAYNAGGQTVERWQSRFPALDLERWVELITYPETKNYVKDVLTAEYFYQLRMKQVK